MNCAKSLGALYAILYIIVMMLCATVIMSGDDKKKIAWALYGISIVTGLLAVILLFTKGCSSSGFVKFGFITLALITHILTSTAMTITKPKMKMSELAMLYFVSFSITAGAIVSSMVTCDTDTSYSE